MPAHRLLIARSSATHRPFIAHSSSAHSSPIVRSSPIHCLLADQSAIAHHIPSSHSEVARCIHSVHLGVSQHTVKAPHPLSVAHSRLITASSVYSPLRGGMSWSSGNMDLTIRQRCDVLTLLWPAPLLCDNFYNPVSWSSRGLFTANNTTPA